MVIRYAESDNDIIATHMLLMHMGVEAAQVPVIPDDVMAELLELRATGAIIMAIEDGFLVGTISLMKSPYWYNLKTFHMHDRFLYVAPTHRGGRVMAGMLAEASALSEAVGLKLFITPFNQARKRGLRGEWKRLAENLKIEPMGSVLLYEKAHQDGM